VFIFLIITILMSSSLLSQASQNYQKDNAQESLKPKGIIPKIFIRAYVVGDASSGKHIGNFSRIGIIKFDYVKFYIYKFIPFRVIINDEINVTAILFGINQEIPEGPFKFAKDLISIAIVF